MLDDITELRTFVRIVGAGSLSAAGREMGLALSVVSKRLAMLERRTEMRLIARSTRHLALTEEGQTLYDRAQRILAEVDEAEAALTHGRVEPQGVLRVSAPVTLGRTHVGPVCRNLVGAHPKVAVDLTLTDRLVELIDEGMDVVVRIGALKDSALVMGKRVNTPPFFVGARNFLEGGAPPAAPAELEDHEFLQSRGVGPHWRLGGPEGDAAEIKAGSRL